MIGNTYLLPRLEPRLREGADEIGVYLRTEFGAAGAEGLLVGSPRPASGSSQVSLNGGRHGWMAKARRVATTAAALLLAPLSRRMPAGRTAPNLLPSSADGAACTGPSHP